MNRIPSLFSNILFLFKTKYFLCISFSLTIKHFNPIQVFLTNLNTIINHLKQLNAFREQNKSKTVRYGDANKNTHQGILLCL